MLELFLDRFDREEKTIAENKLAIGQHDVILKGIMDRLKSIDD